METADKMRKHADKEAVRAVDVNAGKHIEESASHKNSRWDDPSTCIKAL